MSRTIPAIAVIHKEDAYCNTITKLKYSHSTSYYETVEHAGRVFNPNKEDSRYTTWAKYIFYCHAMKYRNQAHVSEEE